MEIDLKNHQTALLFDYDREEGKLDLYLFGPEGMDPKTNPQLKWAQMLLAAFEDPKVAKELERMLEERTRSRSPKIH